jgi:alkaline phosphatase D
MPIRLSDENNKIQIYRNFKYGDLLDLYMMELRLSGKDEPMGFKAAGGGWADLDQEEIANVLNPDREMIDQNQLGWLVGGMTNSQSTWKLMVSSVMMVPFPALFNADAWDGYFVQRETIFGGLTQSGVTNFGAISGDFHMGFASNLVANSLPDITAAVPVGFEFTTPSVTSANVIEHNCNQST